MSFRLRPELSTVTFLFSGTMEVVRSQFKVLRFHLDTLRVAEVFFCFCVFPLTASGEEGESEREGEGKGKNGRAGCQSATRNYTSSKGSASSSSKPAGKTRSPQGQPNLAADAGTGGRAVEAADPHVPPKACQPQVPWARPPAIPHG